MSSPCPSSSGISCPENKEKVILSTHTNLLGAHSDPSAVKFVIRWLEQGFVPRYRFLFFNGANLSKKNFYGIAPGGRRRADIKEV